MKSNVEERGMSKATKVEKPEEVYEEQIVQQAVLFERAVTADERIGKENWR